MSANVIARRLVVVVIVAVVAVGVPWGLWKVTRWWNYNLGYESQVIDTVCLMVKPEYLTAEGTEQCLK